MHMMENHVHKEIKKLMELVSIGYHGDSFSSQSRVSMHV